VRVKTVQVAIPDPAYADSVRNLLIQDVRHQVHLVERPNFDLPGVIILDAICVNSFPTVAKEQKRLLVLAHKERDDLAKLWDAGIRHVLFYEDTPQWLTMQVLGIELSLSANGTSAD
jgi:hypothetical protein